MFETLISSGQGRDDFPVICPFHVTRDYAGRVGPELDASCWINTKKHVFHCFGCGAGGSFVKLKATLEDIPYEQAKWELYRGEIPEFLVLSFYEETTRQEIVYAESYLAPFPPAGAIDSRGIGEAASARYGIRQNEEKDLLLPIRDLEGRLRGIQVRRNTIALDENWYDMELHFRRSACLFGAHLGGGEELILCEGALDAVKLWEVLQIPALAWMGSSISSAQITLISRLHPGPRRITLWNDNDETGKMNLPKNIKRLKNLVAGEVYLPSLNESDPKDPCETNAERVREQWEHRRWYAI